MERLTRVVQAALEHPWAITKEKLGQIRALLQLRAAGLTLSDAEIKARIGEPKSAGASTTSAGGAVAVIPIFGVISHRINVLDDISGGTSTERLAKQLASALRDPSVGSIVLDIDSPGGSVFGVPELAAQIREGRDQKPIVAVANATAGSAAYWLASQASELVVTPSGQVGSVGVYMLHEDYSKALEEDGVGVTLVSAGKYKVEGNPFEPLGDEARAAMQADVDHYYDQFTKDVAKGRGVAVSVVRADFGQGRMLVAADAKAAGMVDRIETLDAAIARVAKQTARKASATALPGGKVLVDVTGADEETQRFDVRPLAETDGVPAEAIAAVEDLEVRRRRLALEHLR